MRLFAKPFLFQPEDVFLLTGIVLVVLSGVYSRTIVPPLGLYVVSQIVPVILSPDPALGLEQIIRIGYFATIAWAISSAVRNVGMLGVVAKSWMFGTAIAVGAGFFGVWRYVVEGYRSNALLLMYPGWDVPRLRSLLYNPNSLANFLSVGVICTVAALADSRSRRATMGYGGLAVAGVMATLLTFSRGGWLGLTIGFAALFFGGSRLRRSVLVVSMVGIVGVSLILLVLDSGPLTLARRISTTKTGDYSVVGRTMNLRTSLNMILENALWGVGLGRFDAAYLTYLKDEYKSDAFPQLNAWAQAPHNMYIGVLGETGIVGFAGFAALLAWFLRVMYRNWTATDDDQAHLRRALVAGGMAILVQGAFADLWLEREVVYGLGLNWAMYEHLLRRPARTAD